MRRNLPTKLLSLFILPIFFSLSIAGDTLTPTQPLSDGETLVSAAGTFVLGFFSLTNSSNRYIGIWYKNISVQTVVWVANRQNPINDSRGILSLSNDGALVITAGNSTVVWTSGSVPGETNPIAQLLDSGNFVFTQVNGTGIRIATWQSFEYPTDTLLPGMKLGWDLKSGLNRNLTSWMSPSDPSPGPYTIFIDLEGDPQLVIQSDSSLFWRGGPWDGIRFAGIPEMDSYNAFNFTFVDNPDEIYYSFSIIDNAIISRVIVGHFGTCQRLVWLDQSSMWNVFWSAPTDQCDRVSPCGPYGVCNTNDSPICNCLQGFMPKSPYDWALRDGTGGCIRRTQLDCTNGTDGFLMMTGVKLPDTTNTTIDMSLNIDECRIQCLKNCSCTAYASANISRTESGCIIWTVELTDLRVYDDSGENLYVRLAAADLDAMQEQSQKSKLPIAAIIGGAAAGLLLLACIGCCIWCRRINRRKAILVATSFKNTTVGGEDFKLPLFDMDTITTATDYFSIQNKLGEGGFGPVYKGKLGGGQEIAVKRLATTSVQGIDEFKNEVMVIAKLQHRDLVRLIGCCIEGEERILVYEYMPNKSLDSFLFAHEVSLDWKTRYHIISGVARGLLYLHHESRVRIIHRDLKASNILLDTDMNPKISDFGMARIFGGDDTEVNTSKVVGTYGYMSPEYAMDGVFSIKSDVFSFGVLVLEIISGKKNRGVFFSEHLNLLGYAWNLWIEGKGLELVDDTIGHSISMVEALKCIKIGLLCVQERPEDRPTMSSVVLTLGSDSAVLPQPKQPGFVARKCSFDADRSLTAKESVTVNDVTVTILDGR